MNVMGTNLVSEFERLLSQWVVALDELSVELVDSENEKIESALSRLQAKVLRLLRGDSRTTEYLEPQDADLFRMHYAFIAYCDDYLLQRYSWSEAQPEKQREYRRLWLKFLCEQKLFGTRAAGAKLPKVMRALVTKGAHKDKDLEMAVVYLRVIWLGFGSGSGEHQAAQSKLRVALSEIIERFRSDSEAPTNIQPLGWMPPPGLVAKRLAPIGRWKKILLYLGLGYILTTCLIWLLLSSWVANILSALG